MFCVKLQFTEFSYICIGVSGNNTSIYVHRMRKDFEWILSVSILHSC